MKRKTLKNLLSLLLTCSVGISVLAVPAWAVEEDETPILSEQTVESETESVDPELAEEGTEETPEETPEEGTEEMPEQTPVDPEVGVEAPVTMTEEQIQEFMDSLPIDPETGDIDFSALTEKQLAALLAVQDGIMTMSIAPTSESDWIAAADSVIAGRGTAPGSWEEYLGSAYYQNVSYDDTGALNWVSSPGVQWNGKGDALTDLTPQTAVTVADQQTAAAGNPDMAPALDTVNKTFYVYSPQQLLYAFRYLNNTSGNTGYTIEIMRDLDFNGAAYSWPTDVTLEDYTTINCDGNGHYMDNLRILQVSTVGNLNCGLISTCTSLQAKGLHFRNAYVCSTSKGNSKTAILVGYPNVGTAGAFADYWQLEDITFLDSIVVNNSATGSTAQGSAAALFGRFMITGGADEKHSMPNAYIKNCNTIGCVFAGGSHTASLTSSMNNMGKVQNCFSVGCSVISYGVHSGGLFSCLARISEISGCFVDTQLYGSSQNGVLTGVAGDCHFYNCFTSGFVEGESILGGFIGAAGSGTDTTIVNCYSTALVGVRSSDASKTQGGFVGRIPNAAGYNMGIVNCYAAGEVGSASTDVDSGATNSSRTDYIGGFVGEYASLGSRAQTAYCYYDKQTTAMREWDNGARKQGYLNVTSNSFNPSVLIDYVKKDDIGLRGVLTTDTAKSGTGLMSAPGATGFMGFKDLKLFYEMDGSTLAAARPIKTPVNTYDYDTYYGWADEATTDPEHEHYPELQFFENADPNIWGAYTSLVKAYSKSSTSGAMLETWENGLKVNPGTKDGDDLDATVYDTVRDLTMRFDLTTVGEQAWQRTETATGEAGTDKATVMIVGVTKDVLVLNPPGAGLIYYCDNFAPGIEWLETEVTVDGYTATRRFRATPTAGVEAGPSQTIYRPGQYAPNAKKDAAYYDHADDVELYFSTAGRMAADPEDITTGIYPDKGETGAAYGADHMTRDSDPLTSRQLALIPGSSSSEITSYFDTHGNDSYGNSGSALQNTGLDVSFMARAKNDPVTAAGQTNNAEESTLYIYVRDISSSIDSDGTVADNSPLIDMTDEDYSKTYNGQALKSKGDQILMFEYVWKLKDGRLIYDAKLITVKATPFNVKINVYESGGLDAAATAANKAEVDTASGLQDTDDAKVGVQRLNGEQTDDEVAALLEEPEEISWAQVYANIMDDSGNYLPNPKGEGNLTADAIGPEYGDASLVSWKVTNSEKVVTRLRLKMDSGRKDDNGNAIFFEATIDDPKEGDDVVIPYEYYRVITASDGSFFISTEKLKIPYTVRYDSTKETYYLAFNHNETALAADHPDLVYDADVVDVANNIQAEIELSARLEVEKTVTGSLGDRAKDFTFTLNLEDDQVANSSPVYSYYIRHADGGKTEDASYTIQEGDANPVTVKLRHGDTVVIPKLHYGATYTIEEASYATDGYTTKADGDISNTMSGALTVTAESPTADGTHVADRFHTYENIKDISPPTGADMKNSPFILFLLLSMGGGALWMRTSMSNKRRRRRRV